MADHSVHCTANDNYNATLGDGTTVCCTDSTPLATGVTDIAIRGDESCVLGTDHSVKCWGLNAQTHLGTGDGAYLIKAPEAQPGVMASQITLGANIGCVLRDMTVACWGQGFFGGVGDATYNDRNMSVAVSNNLIATQVAAGADHACALMSDGTVQCWGNDNDGELGDGVILSPDPSGVRMTCP
jgi:alpha-tubulin suppressor-like RCC1 family protein